VWNGNLKWYGIATSGFITPTKTFQITTSGVVATSTVCVQPSVTPTKTPSISISRTPSATPPNTPPITPTPSISLTPAPTPSASPVTCFNTDLGYNSTNKDTACINFIEGSITPPVGLVGPSNNLSVATFIKRVDCNGTLPASTGYWSDGVIVRYWNGTAFTTQFDCII
jgi:hypothetical protein